MSSTSTQQRKDALVVLGMHRSGTSAMARVLSLSGASLPTNLMGVNESNPNGHWEPEDIINFNDEILTDLDVSWNDIFGPRRRRDGKLPTDRYLGRARDIIAKNWLNQKLIVFKEPRTSLLLDLWRDALLQEGYLPSFIIMVRNPLEVADSLKSRNGFGKNKSVLLWSTYMLSAELSTRNDRRMFVEFADLLDNSEDVINRIETELNIMLPRRTWQSALEIESFLKSEDRHHIRSSKAGLRGFGPVQTFYQYLHDAAQGAIWNEDVSKDLSAWLASLEQTVGPVITELNRDLRRMNLESSSERQRILELDAVRTALQSTEALLRAELEHAQDDLRTREAELSSQLAAARRDAHSAADTNEDLAAQIADLSDQLAAGAETKAHLVSRLAELSVELAAAEEARAALDVKFTQAQSDSQAAAETRADLENRLSELSAELAEAVEAGRKLGADLAQARGDAKAEAKIRSDLQILLTDRSAELERASAANKALKAELTQARNEALSQVTGIRDASNSEIRTLADRLQEAELDVRTARVGEGEALIALAKAKADFASHEAALKSRLSESIEEALRLRNEATAREAAFAAQESELRNDIQRTDQAHRNAVQKIIALELSVSEAQEALTQLQATRQRELAELEMQRAQSAQIAKALSQAIASRRKLQPGSIGTLPWAIIRRLVER